MKKYLIIPMALAATMTVTLGTGSIIEKVIETNNFHIESDELYSKPNIAHDDVVMNVFTLIGGESIELSTRWWEYEKATTSKVVYTLYSTKIGTDEKGYGTLIKDEILEVKEGTPPTKTGTHKDISLFSGLTPNTNYIIEVEIKDKDGKSLIEEESFFTQPTKIEMEPVVQEDGKSVSLTTRWKEASTPAKTISVNYNISSQSLGTTETIQGTVPITTGLQEETVLFENLKLNEEYYITTTLEFADGNTLEKQYSVNTNVTPTIWGVDVINPSIGDIQIMVDFNNKGLPLDVKKSKIELFEVSTEDSTKVLKETIFITEDPTHVYDSSFKLDVDKTYSVEVTLATVYHEEDGIEEQDYSITKVGNLNGNEEFTTINSNDTNITNIEITPTPSTFGKRDGLINIEMTVNEPNADDMLWGRFQLEKITNDNFEETLFFPPGELIEDTLIINQTFDKMYGGKYRNLSYVVTEDQEKDALRVDEITINTKEESKPTISSKMDKPISNEDGSETFQKDSIETKILVPDGSVLEPEDVTGIINYGVIDMEGNKIVSSSSNTNWNPENLEFSLSEDLVIPAENVTAGYEIVLTGLELHWELINDLVIKDKGLSGGAIAGIVIGSIAGVALIGGSTFWILKSKKII